MDNFEIADKHYWEQILTTLNKNDDNFERRYRRYNKSFEVMGAKTVSKEASRIAYIFEDKNSQADCSMGFLQNIDSEKLYHLLSGLNSNEMLIILFVYEKGLNFNDIATIMNSSYDTVQKRHYRAIDKLKKNLIRIV